MSAPVESVGTEVPTCRMDKGSTEVFPERSSAVPGDSPQVRLDLKREGLSSYIQRHGGMPHFLEESLNCSRTVRADGLALQENMAV